MENFTFDFSEFINRRIEDKLNKNKLYIKESIDFENLQNEIYNNCSENQRKAIDNMLNILFSMKLKEFSVAYKVGFNDGAKFTSDYK